MKAALALALLALGGVGAFEAPVRPLQRRLPRLQTLHASAATSASSAGEPESLPRIWPCGDALDKRIGALALPAVVNFLVLPVTQAVDCYWVGRMGEALATAGQAAANQVFSSAFWLTSFIPTITTPLVAASWAKDDMDAVQRHIGAGIFVSVCIGAILTIALAVSQQRALLLVGTASGLPFSMPYMRWRLPGVLPDAASVVGFSAFRGVLDTVTPLKISLASNLLNMALDPLCIFSAKMGVAGAALATSVSQIFAASCYLALLLRRKLVRWSTMLRPPSREALARLAQGGAAVQIRAVALNIAFLAVTRTTQRLDATGTAAAAHAVALQLWQLGGVVLFAVSTVASILVPAELNREGGGKQAARAAASRFLAWGSLLGAGLCAVQLAALPALGAFSTVPEVQAAARTPYMIGALLQIINGITFIGEGVMLGTGSFIALAAGQLVATSALLLALSRASSLASVWMGFWVFNSVRMCNVLRFHFISGPLTNLPKDAK